MIGKEKNIHRFAGFQLETLARRLSIDGKTVALTPKVFDTLVFLVENAGRAILRLAAQGFPGIQAATGEADVDALLAAPRAT